MNNQNINQQFREDEITYIRRWDKDRNEYITNPYPKIGGRLRLAHDNNEALSIETDVIRYDEQIAVVSAVSKTSKGSFRGIGMASVQRDERLAQAILELAETRAIARSLRFAGYGVEYCSAEEVSNLENGNGYRAKENDNLPSGGHRNGGNGSSHSGNGNDNGNNHPNGSDRNGKISDKQMEYLIQLNEDRGRNKAELDNFCREAYGCCVEYLSKRDASCLIRTMLPI